jgi:hypothetical protein
MNCSRSAIAALSLIFIACAGSAAPDNAAPAEAERPGENATDGDETEAGKRADPTDAGRPTEPTDPGTDAGKPTDAAPASDAGPAAGLRISCGGGYCRSDQSCVQDKCVFSCAGTNVPGDYATLSSAVTALAATGTDATICLGAQSNLTSTLIEDPGAHGKSLRIVGVSQDQTKLGSIEVRSGFSKVTLVGFAVASGLSVVGVGETNLLAMRIASQATALKLGRPSTATPSVIDVDGCEITSTSTPGFVVNIENNYAKPFSVALKNSYIHGAGYGIYAGGPGATSLSIVNNTIMGSNLGLTLSPASTSSITYANNIVAGHAVYGVSLSAGLSATHTNNALFGNTNNYAGLATDGPGYVKQDCQLETVGGMPQPKAGSPCLAAADPAKAPATDFWNAPRPANATIGAVERQ